MRFKRLVVLPALNFFDAVLKDDPAALARLDPAAVAGLEDVRYWRK